MAEEVKKGILSRLFGPKSSSCCNMIKIEEVTEEQPQSPDDKDQDKTEQTSEVKPQK